MKEYDEEYLTPSPEERREQEQREEIKRIVRGEMRRVESGEADEDIAADEQREREQQQEAERKKSRCPRWVRGIRLFLTGDILLDGEVSHFYNYVSYIALMFFLSIVTLFAALRLEMRRDGLEREVELLHERSIRMKEQRYRQCSHSAVMQRLQERGIELYDPLAPNDVIK